MPHSSTAPALSIVRAGAGHGPCLVYFHGTPGSADEVQWWHAAAQAHGVQLWCPQRYALPSALQGAAYFTSLAQSLAAQLGTLQPASPVVLVGFSLGGFVAVQVAVALQQLQVPLAGVHLVSAAAPLQGGDFLQHMAGQVVFRLAAERPALLRGLTGLQGGLARLWPLVLQRMLFASAQASDRALASDPQFRATLQQVLRTALCDGREGYLRELADYVQPWGDQVARLEVPTWVWHGAQDNWSPPGMAHWFSAHLPQGRGVEMLPGQSHYGCLLAAVAPICAHTAALATRG